MAAQAEATPVRGASQALGEIMRCLHLLDTPAWIHLDLSMAQFKALMLVASTGGLTGRDLAQRLRICPSAVTPLVDRLVQHGHVRREEDPSDRRISWTRPTAAGIALFDRVVAGRRQLLEEVLATLSPSDLELVARGLALLRDATARRLADATKQKSCR